MYRCRSCGAFNRLSESHPGTPVCGRCKAELDTSGAPQAVTAEELERAAAASPVPVVVDVWAPWCPPCRAVSPVLDQIAHERAGKIVVLKLNSDEQPMHKLAVAAIPTFIVYKGGRELDRKSGAMPKHLLDAWIAEKAA
jgi:thioredoxin 2